VRVGGGGNYDTVMQVAKFEANETLIGLCKTDIHVDNERIIDAVESTLRFDHEVETKRNSK
jgi:hypothetical protein